MVLEYSGRHLAMLELASALKLTLYLSLIACLFAPWGLATTPDPAEGAPGSAAFAALPAAAYVVGLAAFAAKLAVGAVLLAIFETAIAKMRVFRVPEFLGAALMLGLLGTLLLFFSRSL
jgi:formate hydrogenlyase subunit 4